MSKEKMTKKEIKELIEKTKESTITALNEMTFIKTAFEKISMQEIECFKIEEFSSLVNRIHIIIDCITDLLIILKSYKGD